MSVFSVVKRVLSKPGFHHIDTPNGLFTAAGFWFATRPSVIESLVPGLLAVEPLDDLLQQAERWIRSSEGLALWVFLGLLLAQNVFWAATVSIIVYVAWYFLRSAVATPVLDPLVKGLTFDAPVLLASVAVISWVGHSGRTADALIGLGWFFTYRFGWLRMLLDRWHNASRPLPVNDRILRMLLFRSAIRNGITPKPLQTMKDDIGAAMRKSTLVPLLLLALGACSTIQWVEKPDDYRNALILVSDIPTDAIRFDAKVLGDATQTWFLETGADSLYTLGISRLFFSPDIRSKNVRLAADYRNSDYRFVVESVDVTQRFSVNFVKPGPILKVEVRFAAYRGEDLVLRVRRTESANMASIDAGPGFNWLDDAAKSDVNRQRKALSEAYYTALGNAILIFFNQNTY
jgi:hypothetical protein